VCFQAHQNLRPPHKEPFMELFLAPAATPTWLLLLGDVVRTRPYASADRSFMKRIRPCLFPSEHMISIFMLSRGYFPRSMGTKNLVPTLLPTRQTSSRGYFPRSMGTKNLVPTLLPTRQREVYLAVISLEAWEPRTWFPRFYQRVFARKRMKRRI
jgi:hypothetical protein